MSIDDVVEDMKVKNKCKVVSSRIMLFNDSSAIKCNSYIG
jgi:hypothetical protein